MSRVKQAACACPVAWHYTHVPALITTLNATYGDCHCLVKAQSELLDVQSRGEVFVADGTIAIRLPCAYKCGLTRA